MAVEAVVARSMARRAREGPKDKAKTKVKSEARVEDAEALTGRTGTRTRTGRGEASTLHQGGPTFEPSAGQRDPGLQPVLRRKRNKEKELRVA